MKEKKHREEKSGQMEEKTGGRQIETERKEKKIGKRKKPRKRKNQKKKD